MPDFVIMTKPFVIVMRFSSPSKINGLRMTMTKPSVMPLRHPGSGKTHLYQRVDLKA